jgi:hypothetical protein
MPWRLLEYQQVSGIFSIRAGKSESGIRLIAPPGLTRAEIQKTERVRGAGRPVSSSSVNTMTKTNRFKATPTGSASLRPLAGPSSTKHDGSGRQSNKQHCLIFHAPIERELGADQECAPCFGAAQKYGRSNTRAINELCYQSFTLILSFIAKPGGYCRSSQRVLRPTICRELEGARSVDDEMSGVTFDSSGHHLAKSL